MRVLPIAACVMAMFSTGCQQLMPYVQSERLDRSFPKAEGEPANEEPFAGDIEDALRAVDQQRAAYYQSLRARTAFRDGLSTALIGLSALAVYRGVTATTDGGRRMVTRYGVAAGAAYTAGAYADNPQTEDAYVQAVEDLTCLALRTRPWLMPRSQYGKFVHDMKKLEEAIDALEREYGQVSAEALVRGRNPKYLHYYSHALYVARSTLRSASHYRGYVESAGFQLRQEGALVVARTNGVVRLAQHPLANPKDVVSQLSAINEAFRNIKPPPVSDTGGAASPQTPDDGDGTGTDTDTPAAAPAPLAASTSKQAAPAAAPASTAQSAMGAEADKMAKAIDALGQRVAKDEKETGKAIKKIRSELEKIGKDGVKPQDAIQLRAELLRRYGALPALASEVFVRMRPVTLVLTRAYSLRPYVKAIAECRPAGDQALQFTVDGDDVVLKAGQSLDVGVTGGVGVPHVWLGNAYAGPSGEKPEFKVTIEGGLARAQLRLPADLPGGDLTLYAVDHTGRSKDSLKVTVQAAAAPAPAATPAAPAASDPASKPAAASSDKKAKAPLSAASEAQRLAVAAARAASNAEKAAAKAAKAASAASAASAAAAAKAAKAAASKP